MDLTLSNKIRRGEIDINNQSLFFSILIKGLLNKLHNDLKIRGIEIPHIILNSGDDILYLSVKGHDQSKEPYEVTNENHVYNIIPRCVVNPKGINLIPDQLTTPYSNGVFVYEGEDEITTFSAEFRRMPLTMSFEMTYLLDTYSDSIELIQQIISKLSFIQIYYITYMGQQIACSYKMPESFDSDYTVTVDGNYSDDKVKKISVNIEVETNFPIYNNRSVIQADNYIKSVNVISTEKAQPITSYNITYKTEQLHPHKEDETM